MDPGSRQVLNLLCFTENYLNRRSRNTYQPEIKSCLGTRSRAEIFSEKSIFGNEVGSSASSSDAPGTYMEIVISTDRRGFLIIAVPHGAVLAVLPYNDADVVGDVAFTFHIAAVIAVVYRAAAIVLARDSTKSCEP